MLIIYQGFYKRSLSRGVITILSGVVSQGRSLFTSGSTDFLPFTQYFLHSVFQCIFTLHNKPKYTKGYQHKKISLLNKYNKSNLYCLRNRVEVDGHWNPKYHTIVTANVSVTYVQLGPYWINCHTPSVNTYLSPLTVIISVSPAPSVPSMPDVPPLWYLGFLITFPYTRRVSRRTTEKVNQRSGRELFCFVLVQRLILNPKRVVCR